MTRLLEAWSGGDDSALNELMPLVYGGLSEIAKGYLRGESRDHTLQTGALVNEAYVRLLERRKVSLRSRNQFRALAAQTMRRVLIDHARRKKSAKRRWDLKTTLATDAAVVARDRPTELLLLEVALSRLEDIDSRQAQVVELRYFGGCTTRETAEILGVSPATVKRDWTMARAWLYQQVAGDG